MNFNNLGNAECGARLKCLLAAVGMRQKEFAEKANYTQQHISQVISGKKRMTEELADRALEILETKPPVRKQWLLGIDDFMTLEEKANFFQKEQEAFQNNLDSQEKSAKNFIWYTAKILGLDAVFREDGQILFFDGKEKTFVIEKERFNQLSEEFSHYAEYLLFRLMMGTDRLQESQMINMERSEYNGSNSKAD